MIANINPSTILQVSLEDLRTIINEVIADTRREAEQADRRVGRAEAAGIMGVTPGTIGNWIKSGLLPAIKVGGRTLIRTSDLENLSNTKKL